MPGRANELPTPGRQLLADPGEGTLALRSRPTATTVTAPITLCQRNEICGAPNETAKPDPQINPS